MSCHEKKAGISRYILSSASQTETTLNYENSKGPETIIYDLPFLIFPFFLVPALAGVGAAAGSAAVGAPSSKVIDAHLAVQATIR